MRYKCCIVSNALLWKFIFVYISVTTPHRYIQLSLKGDLIFASNVGRPLVVMTQSMTAGRANFFCVTLYSIFDTNVKITSSTSLYTVSLESIRIFDCFIYSIGQRKHTGLYNYKTRRKGYTFLGFTMFKQRYLIEFKEVYRFGKFFYLTAPVCPGL